MIDTEARAGVCHALRLAAGLRAQPVVEREGRQLAAAIARPVVCKVKKGQGIATAGNSNPDRASGRAAKRVEWRQVCGRRL
ncbi:hypothetical protein HJO_09749 [Hyphomonas johnsonii MHS-2]|uniref:Uncharacterized protein n=1 Tax=Hyphomonas johnsonii MHS-2 TaxID=1280950 RepID=A0A059FNT9_9PROT|nr:hypothetical protein HJO_09749 [Hyphomonas johnsonii MHS-2]